VFAELSAMPESIKGKKSARAQGERKSHGKEKEQKLKINEELIMGARSAYGSSGCRADYKCDRRKR
jgi:hypothetical protein